MPSPVPTSALERELALASSLGVLASYKMRRSPGGERRFTLTFPDGSHRELGTGAVEAFCLAVRWCTRDLDEEVSA